MKPCKECGEMPETSEYMTKLNFCCPKCFEFMVWQLSGMSQQEAIEEWNKRNMVKKMKK